MDDTLKKNLSILLLLVVVGSQFFCYIGSNMINLNVLRSLHGLIKPISTITNDWIWITICGRIIGAYALYKLTLHLGFFKVMRIIVIAHILLAISVSSHNFTGTVLYQDLQFLFVHRLIHAFLIPASFMLPSLFLLNHYSDKPIMLSAYISFGIGLGVLALYQYLAIVKFAEGWHNIMLYASVFSGICYFLAEKLLSKTSTIEPSHTVKLSLMRFLLVFAFGGICGITFSYHFTFVDPYIKDVLITGDCQSTGFAYYYYALVAAIIPVARFVYKQDIFAPLKITTLAIALAAITLAIFQQITANLYIVEQAIFGLLAAVLFVPCHTLVYQLFKGTRNYFEGIFWFVTGFTLFAVTPHIFLKLLGVKSLPWLGLLYILPIAFLFIFALSQYEKELKNGNYGRTYRLFTLNSSQP